MTHEEAISNLQNQMMRFAEGIEPYIALQMAIDSLRECRWIPVTERLPEDGERVLATHLGGLDPNRQVIEHTYENGKFVDGWYMDMNMDSPTFGQRYMGDIIAWMPMPKPYERSEEE